MIEGVSAKVSELVGLGWLPRTTTETSASLSTRSPFAWWLFIIVVVLLPGIGGILYIAFWLATGRVTVFVYEQGGEVRMSGDTWMIDKQNVRREALIEEQRQIKERGFWSVMWPKLVVMGLCIVAWIVLLDWIY